MTVKTLSAEMTRTAVRGALAAKSGPPYPLSIDLRNVIVLVLNRALTGPVPLAEYLATLKEEADHSTGSPSPNPNQPVPHFNGVLVSGVGILDDDTLAGVATDPTALQALEEAVERADLAGELGEAWEAVYDGLASDLPPDYLHSDRSRRMMDEIIATERGLVAVNVEPSRPNPPRAERPPRQWVRLAVPLALAASLLLAFYLGTFWPGRDGRQEVRLASVAVRGDVTRGIGDVALELTNGADRRAFVTVVGLVPGRKTPAYHYRVEGRYVELPPGGTAEVKNLPPEFEGSTVLLVVSTPVPAGGVVRDATPAAAAPDAADRTAEQLRAALSDLGIPADVRVVPVPAQR